MIRNEFGQLSHAETIENSPCIVKQEDHREVSGTISAVLTTEIQ